MENLSKIPTEGVWVDIARLVNENFTKVGMSIDTAVNNPILFVPFCRSTTEAEEFIPNPKKGQITLIGRSFPADIYKWDGFSWVYTGGRVQAPSVDLAPYATIEKLNQELALRDARIAALEAKVNVV